MDFAHPIINVVSSFQQRLQRQTSVRTLAITTNKNIKNVRKQKHEFPFTVRCKQLKHLYFKTTQQSINFCSLCISTVKIIFLK